MSALAFALRIVLIGAVCVEGAARRGGVAARPLCAGGGGGTDTTIDTTTDTAAAAVWTGGGSALAGRPAALFVPFRSFLAPFAVFGCALVDVNLDWAESEM
jgi:hypothetical protein